MAVFSSPSSYCSVSFLWACFNGLFFCWIQGNRRNWRRSLQTLTEECSLYTSYQEGGTVRPAPAVDPSAFCLLSERAFVMVLTDSYGLVSVRLFCGLVRCQKALVCPGPLCAWCLWPSGENGWHWNRNSRRWRREIQRSSRSTRWDARCRCFFIACLKGEFSYEKNIGYILYLCLNSS